MPKLKPGKESMGYWDKDKDIVWICPNGTKGEVMTIAGLKIGFPKVPTKEEILFYDLPKEEQFWQREPTPAALADIDSDEEFQNSPVDFRRRWDAYIKEQYRRRYSGVWFYNCGKPTYLPGHYWFFLQWVQTDFGYGYFFETQWELEVHWAACMVDPRCSGQNFVKNRRFGWTTLAVSETIETLTRSRNAHCGILSKTGEDAKKLVFQEKAIYFFNNLPFFFKPLVDGSTNPKTELLLRAPASKITKHNRKRRSGAGLNSRLTWKATANNSYDGLKLIRLIHDEAGKYERPANIEVSWSRQKRCFADRNKIVGKCRMGSTVNPMDEGGKEYKNLFYQGLLYGDNIEGRNANGRTSCGLYSIFIPAYRCIFYDKYGRSIVDDPKSPVETIDGEMTSIGGRTYLLNEREALKGDPYRYNEEIRQMPFNLLEAFMDTLTSCVFNLQRIEEQRLYNANLTQNPVVRGNFAWKNGIIDSQVEWCPDDKAGRFNVVWLPPVEDRSQISRRGMPPFAWRGVGGVDPYAVNEVAHGEGSKGAVYLYNKVDPNGANKMFVLEYVKRAKSLEMFYEDCLMAAVFYGYPLLIESNKYEIAHYFQRRGYFNYLFNRPMMSFAPGTRPSASERLKKGIYANAEINAAMDAIMESYVNTSVGYNEEGEMGRLYFGGLLDQLKEYHPLRRTKFDGIVAAEYALYASRIDIQRAEEQKRPERYLRKYTM